MFRWIPRPSVHSRKTALAKPVPDSGRTAPYPTWYGPHPTHGGALATSTYHHATCRGEDIGKHFIARSMLLIDASAAFASAPAHFGGGGPQADSRRILTIGPSCSPDNNGRSIAGAARLS